MLSALIRRYKKDYAQHTACFNDILELSALIKREVDTFWNDRTRVISETSMYVEERYDFLREVQREFNLRVSDHIYLYKRLYWFEKKTNPLLITQHCRVTDSRVQVAMAMTYVNRLIKDQDQVSTSVSNGLREMMAITGEAMGNAQG